MSNNVDDSAANNLQLEKCDKFFGEGIKIYKKDKKVEEDNKLKIHIIKKSNRFKNG